jgi:hypothetical protein
MRALGEADTLVVLGYGFPKTDAKARTEIQRAFAGGTSSPAVRRVDFLLGPDTSGPEARRVHALLEANGGRREIVWFPQKPKIANPALDRILHLTAHPLWVEDFIFDYAQLTQNTRR